MLGLKNNVCTEGRFTRIFVGSLLLLSGLYFKTLWGLIGLLPLFMGIIGWCFIYQIFGISTYESEEKERPPSEMPEGRD
jgi:hypothetical protein